ncbi:hypothetical protein SAMN05216327_11868 [Dyadobacter sp. SG02]|uniref:hypothetical protein n=1 Tax=Dyadobacter sp. SG02 TaxID=1855291 RepID=UPI0008CC71D4|nr:hypothetical protein [Dyadobacter sp. SG02]SEJ74922.1 hypothetical protein SAMN05216327_11868 [Dyadobacter sp. SG02]
MHTATEFTQEEMRRMIAANQKSLALPNGWNLRTQFEWNEEWQVNLSDLKTLPEGENNIDELISSFLVDKQEWNQHFADFIQDFGLAALIAAKDAILPVHGEISGDWVFFVGEEADFVHVREIVINFSERLISIVLKRC